MDEAEWERAMMAGHPFTNPWIPRPKLEIPNIESATPRRRGTSAQSPRGIYDFPVSPESPGERMMLSPPMKPPPMKTIPRPPWVQDSMDQVTMCTQFSPGSNHPGHGFGDCNAECSSSRNFGHRAPVSPSPVSPILDIGENVLVRCNQTKWLAGQVRRISSTSVKVWIGAAETMVNVPVELFSTHLARVGCTTPCSSPRDGQRAGLPEIRARVQCVRPAHLSHRQLYQIISPGNPAANNPCLQMHQAQCTSSAPKDPRTTYRYCHCLPPSPASNPSNLPDHVAAYFEKKKGLIPPFPTRSILKRPGSLSEPLNPMREDSNLMGITFDGHGGVTFDGHGGFSEAPAQAQAHAQAHAQAQAQAQAQAHAQAQAQAQAQAHAQAQYSWRQHVARSSQQGNRPSYSRPSALPMLNVNLNNEGTPSGSPYMCKGNCNCHTSPILKSHEQLYNINPESPLYASEEDTFESPLDKPQYDLFVEPQLLSEATDLLTKTTIDSGVVEIPKEPPTLSRMKVKGKEMCEDEACPSWAEGTDFLQISESSKGMPLERSVSLDSFQSPAFPGLVDPRSPGARPPRNATSSAEPVWVTVIDNGYGTRKP